MREGVGRFLGLVIVATALVGCSADTDAVSLASTSSVVATTTVLSSTTTATLSSTTTVVPGETPTGLGIVAWLDQIDYASGLSEGGTVFGALSDETLIDFLSILCLSKDAGTPVQEILTTGTDMWTDIEIRDQDDVDLLNRAIRMGYIVCGFDTWGETMKTSQSKLLWLTDLRESSADQEAGTYIDAVSDAELFVVYNALCQITADGGEEREKAEAILSIAYGPEDTVTRADLLVTQLAVEELNVLCGGE